MNDDNIWIKTVNIRVESMPLRPDSSELSTGTGMEDLGKMHCNEYRANESNIPENDRKSVAISRLEGFFSIRDYIQTKGSREQKFHLDASIIGAVLFAALKEDTYDELLKYKKIAEKIKSDLLSTLYGKISLAVEGKKELFAQFEKELTDFSEGENIKKIFSDAAEKKEDKSEEKSKDFNIKKHKQATLKIKNEINSDSYIRSSYSKLNINDMKGAIADCDKANELSPNHPNIKKLRDDIMKSMPKVLLQPDINTQNSALKSKTKKMPIVEGFDEDKLWEKETGKENTNAEKNNDYFEDLIYFFITVLAALICSVVTLNTFDIFTIIPTSIGILIIPIVISAIIASSTKKSFFPILAVTTIIVIVIASIGNISMNS
tara:strand:+ start:24 stop:1151 length:1128 start_codon:yes stop_codon:yes gene_type:complete